MGSTRLFGRSIAVFAATAITLGSVCLLSMLNAFAIPTSPAPLPIRTVMIHSAASDSTYRPQHLNEPEPTPPEQEQMMAELTPPTIEPLTLQPLKLDLDLPSPEINDARVRIHTPRVKPVQQPQTKPQPAPKPVAPKSTTPAVYRADKVDHPPREGAGNPQPKYPALEQGQGVEATVILQVLIDETGQVKNAKVVRGPEPFRTAVLNVIFDWKFKPAQHEQRPVKVWGVKQFEFKIRQP